VETACHILTAAYCVDCFFSCDRVENKPTAAATAAYHLSCCANYRLGIYCRYRPLWQISSQPDKLHLTRTLSTFSTACFHAAYPLQLAYYPRSQFKHLSVTINP